MLLVMERFGYPDFLLATSDELVDGQYADRLQLRPVCDRLLEIAAGLGEVTIQTRKTYIALVGPRRTFAQIVATTKTRVDLGLRLDGESPHGRLLDAKNLGNRSCSVRIPLTAVDQVDDEVVAELQRAYDANLYPGGLVLAPGRPGGPVSASHVVGADRLRRIRFARQVAQPRDGVAGLVDDGEQGRIRPGAGQPARCRWSRRRRR